MLVVQLILVAVMFFPESESETITTGPLLADFNTDDVTELRVQDAEGAEIHLTRNDIGLWVLPEYDDFPARPEVVSELLDRLGGLQANRLIAQNSSSHNRLRVGGDAFEREVEINGGDTTLFIGTTAGANATHVRLGGDENVYLASGLSAFDANVTLSAWINSQYFSVPSENVTALTLENNNGLFEFVKQGEEWVYLGLGEDETLNPQAFDTLLNQSTAVRMTAPISREEDDDFGMDEPRAVVTLTVSEPVPVETEDADTDTDADAEAEPEMVETTYTLTLGALVEEADFAFKASDKEYFVRVSANTSNGFVDRDHEGFLIITEEEAEAGAASEGE